MQKSSWSDSKGSKWWQGRSGTSRWHWDSGWDEAAAWSSAGWQDGSWQGDDGEDSSKDPGHDVEDPEGHGGEKDCADGEDEKGADDEPPAPSDSAAEPADGKIGVQPAEDDEEALEKLHKQALDRFFQDKPELGSDDETPSGARTRMLVDEDIDAGIAELDPATGGVTCKLCNIALNSKSQWADHQKGKKHFKKVSAEERKRGTHVQKLDKANVPAASYSRGLYQ
mmetsp:Transcript_30884/g.81077  ORF Transcript_30884/g.81077 Transcript_30884/m.81077 type:complete len:225 (-) Transcript_30884:6-680(-)